MPNYLKIPCERLEAATLRALLEEMVTRDGTDYGTREQSLAEKMARLEAGVRDGEVILLYEEESQSWELVSTERAAALLDG